MFLPSNTNPLTRKKSPVLAGSIGGVTGQIAHRVLRLTQDSLIEIMRYEDTNLITDYINMLERDPVARSCMELKALRATTAIGDYTHSNKKYQEWVNKNFQLMDGSISSLVGSLCSAMALGFAVAEIIFHHNHKDEWRLKGINILDPRRVSFAGKRGEIEYVYYSDGTGGKKRIPYRKCIHITGGYSTNFNDPFGSAECRRALPYFKAKQALLSEMIIAGKNNATGIWVGFADSNNRVQLFDAQGKPMKDSGQNDVIVSATQSLNYQLQQLDNHSTLVTDINNRVETRQINSGEQFWSISLDFLNNEMSRAFHVPALIFKEGTASIGQGSVSATHKSVLDSTVEAIVVQIKEEILNKVIKPLLVFNFGYLADLGDFQAQVISDPQTKGMQLNNLVTATSSGLISAQDPDVINAVRNILELSELTEEDKEKLKTVYSMQQDQTLQQQSMAGEEDNTGVGAQYP